MTTDTVVQINYVPNTSEKLYAFDLDGTITHTRSGKILPVDQHDYRKIDQAVLDKLASIPHCYIITNQKRMSTKPSADNYRLKRLQNIFADLVAAGISCTILAATADDRYRKPFTGIYESWLVHPKLQRMLFVGDAAGRSGDFADSDRAFAYNCGFVNAQLEMTGSLVSFQTPEMYFYDQPKPAYTWFSEIPEDLQQKTFVNLRQMAIICREYPNTYNNALMECVQMAIAQKTVFIMCGRPGSGKSTFAKHLTNLSPQIQERGGAEIAIVSNDISGSFAKTKVAARSDPDKSIIVDNTNPKSDVRQYWVDYANSINSACIIIWLDVPEATAHYNNALRVMSNKTPVPKIAYNIFNKQFSPPNECKTLRITYAYTTIGMDPHFGMRI